MSQSQRKCLFPRLCVNIKISCYYLLCACHADFSLSCKSQLPECWNLNLDLMLKGWQFSTAISVVHWLRVKIYPYIFISEILELHILKFVWISLNVSPGIRRYVFQPLSFRIILQKYTWLYFCICFKKNIFLTWHALAQIQASKTLGYSKCCKICAYLMHFKSFCKIDNPNA